MQETENNSDSSRAQDIWSPKEPTCRDYDSDSNPFEDDRAVTKIKPEVELKEETEGFVYKADISGHLKLVCSATDLPNNSALNEEIVTDCSTSRQDNGEDTIYTEFVPADIDSQNEHPKTMIDAELATETSIDGSRYPNNLSPFGPNAIMTFPTDQKYIDAFQVSPTEYSDSHQKLFSIDDNFHNRCCTELVDNCENKLSYYIEMNNVFSGGKQLIPQARDGNESSWMYNMQAMRLTEDVINVSDLSYVKDSYSDLDDTNKTNSSDNEMDLWQLYQELLMQKKMEGKLLQSDEEKKEKMKEIGRIRARLYRSKLKQNDEVWKKHKAMRAKKQREERQKMSDEQREKIKALARIRAKKHREKLKENEEAWKKYKEMRAEKQRLDRLKAKEHVKEEEQQLELMRLAEQSAKTKELARERAKKHRERLKEDSDMWLLYKEARAQRKREERLTMPDDQRQRLKEMARVRAKKYRDKLKENADEWKRYKEMRARKQREERLKLTDEDKLKAKALARERAKLYREKKRLCQQVPSESKTDDGISEPHGWYDSSNSESNNNCSVYFYHTFLQNVSKETSE